MKRVLTLAAACAVAMSAQPVPLHAAAPGDGSVLSLSVVPATGKAEVVIGIDGTVTVQDFVLRSPDRIVVDVTGASLGLPAGDYYDRVARGGIVNVRYSQYRSDVVRVVLTLDGARHYTVSRADGEVRIAVEGSEGQFAAWHMGDQRPAARATVSVAVDGDVRPAAQEREPAPAAPVTQAASRAPSVDSATFRSTDSRQPDRTQQRSQQPHITIAWENADITDVLAAFASFSGRTIIPSKNVKGNVTAEIVNQPWDVAMRAILNANGFDAREDAHGIIIVDTYENISSRQTAEPVTTRTIRLNYVRANNVAPLIEPRLTRDCRMIAGAPSGAPGGTPTPQVSTATCPVRGAVTADTLTNSVSITDVPSMLDELEAYARSLDIRQPQVNIRARIILVDRTELEALGIRYDLGTQQQFFNDIVPRLDSTGRARTDAGQVFLGGNAVSAIANAQGRVASAALQVVYSTAFGNYDLSTFLEALQQTSLLDVQAEPSATVLNNRTANLTAGIEVPLRTIDVSAGGGAAGGGAGGSNFPRAVTTLKPTGIILNVTPSVTANRQVQMKVHVENSDVQFANGDAFAFPRQTVDNEVLVADGETAVMGGLTQTTVRYSRSGIPILVDLPLIGRLFGVTRREEQKRDLLILITPHIIDAGGNQ